MADPAPNPLDAVIRAACAVGMRAAQPSKIVPTCAYPSPNCECDIAPEMVRAALRAALAETPEVVEAMARAMFDEAIKPEYAAVVGADGPRDPKRWQDVDECEKEMARSVVAAALAALRAHFQIEGE